MSRTLLKAALLAVMATSAVAEDVTIDTATGPATVPHAPKSVAVYDMGSLDMLDALGVEGISSTAKTFLPYLSEYQSDIGTLFEPDYEALNALAPELVIVGGRSSPKVDSLSKLAPTIDMTMWGDNLLDQTRARLATYGELFDKQDEAAALTAKLDDEIAATEAVVKGKGNALLLMTNGGKISAYGAGGRFGWIHTEIGLPEVIDGLKDTEHGESVSFEFIRETDPDWILVLDRVSAIGVEGESAKATLDNPIIADTKAAKAGHIIYLNSGGIYIAGGGIQSTLETLDIIKTAFSGDNS